MKTSVAVAAVFALAPFSHAHAVEYKVDFFIESSTPTVSGTPPYGLPSTDIDLKGSFTTHESGIYSGTLGSGFIDSIDFTAGSRTYLLADIRQSFAQVIYDSNNKPFRFSIDLDDGLDDMLGYNENGSEFVLNGALANSIFCDGCVSITVNTAEVSPVPLPASAPMFGAGLLGLGVAGFRVKRKKASVA